MYAGAANGVCVKCAMRASGRSSRSKPGTIDS